MTSVRISVAVVAAAALCAATSLLVLDRPSTDGLLVASVFAVALLAHHGFGARFGRGGGEHETLSSEEAVLAALLIVVTPSLAAAAIVLPLLARELVERKPTVKRVFNVSSFTLAASVAGLLVHGLGAPSGLWLALAAMVAGFVFAATTQLLLSGVLATVGVGTFRALLADDLRFRSGLMLLNVTLGALAGVSVAHDRRALPLVLVALATGHVGVVGYARARAGSDRLRDMIASSADGIVSIDARHRVTAWNPAAEEFFGVNAAAALGKPLPEVLSMAGIDPALLATVDSPGSYTLTGTTTGTRRTITLSSSELAEGGRVFVGRDVTSAAAAHAEARATQERLRNTLRRTGSAVWEYDLATGEYVWTENFAAAVGETEDWSPSSATESRARLDLVDRKRYEDALAALPAGGSLVEEVRVTWPDGSVHWLEIDAEVSADGLVRGLARIIDARKQADAEREAATDRALRTLELLEQINDAFLSIDRDWRIVYVNRAGEHYLRRTRELLVGKNILEEYPDLVGSPVWRAYHEAMNGPEPVQFEVRYEPLDMLMEGTAYPTPEGISVVYRDVKNERQLEEQLRQSQKMEAVGQLAGGIAHDFNNLLTAINGNTELGLLDPDLPDSMRPLLEDVALAGSRAGDLTRQLLSFSRQQVLPPRVISLNDVVVEAESLIRRLIGASIDVVTCLDPLHGHVHADPGGLSQVVLNLAVNARDVMPDGGTLTLSARTVETDGDPDVPDGAWALLSVSDTGCGMTPETVTRIFEPFFTTKPEGKGTGLGLSTVFGIVQQSSGHVTVQTAVGVGTTFDVWLPLTAAGDSVSEHDGAQLLGPAIAR